MPPSPLELAHRQRRFWHFLRMRMLRRSDTIYRNYDMLARWNEGSSADDFRWAGFRAKGEALKPAMRRLHHNIWLKHDRRMTDVALMHIMREYVIWQMLHDNALRDWPLRQAHDIARLYEEDMQSRGGKHDE